VTTAVFGVLEDVSPRLAWPHEAISFTPWLAANLGRLGSQLGLELELEGQEVRVGPFSADILAINVRDGHRVLIENQLEEGDHRHLGQILTYLTGLDARTVVWVATRFRDEHLSAIRWLNEHASDGASFFAVRLRVVRIGDSPFAPLFDVVERPNDWDRRLQEAAQESRDLSAVSARRQDFWSHAVKRHPSSGLTPGSSPARWVPLGTLDLVVSAFVGQQSVGVFLRGGRGKGQSVLADVLTPNALPLQAALGVELGSADFPFTSRLELDMTEPANWDRAADWLAEQIERYAVAVRSVLCGTA
jgi:hypothetical protein